nr:DNA repair protein RecO [Kofleriaceae bacterium]
MTGVLLRALPYRDADLVLHLFSSERGRVGLLARGARRSKRRFVGATSGFVLARFTIAPGKSSDLAVAASAEVLRQWDALATDVGAFAHANYVLELVHELLPEGQPEPVLLALLVDYFDELLVRGASSSVLRYVEHSVLDIAGTPPQLEQCVRCDGELDRNAG